MLIDQSANYWAESLILADRCSIFILNEPLVKSDTFFSLPFYDQLRTLYFSGSFVTAIRYYKYKVNLYMLGDFYVEVFFNHKEDRIERIDLLDTSCTRVKFYADQIKLPKDLLLGN